MTRRVKKGGEMPYFHCNECHHEFEAYPEKKGAECVAPKCDWCGADSYMLENETPLEKMGENIDELLDKLVKECVVYEKSNNNR